MAETPLIEIREPGRPPRRMAVDRSMEVGREGTGVALADVGVSRRHLKLLPSPLGLSVVDLGSRNGTMVNGVAITGRTVLEPGDLLRLGGTEIVVVGRPRRGCTADASWAWRAARARHASPWRGFPAVASRSTTKRSVQRHVPDGDYVAIGLSRRTRSHRRRGHGRTLAVVASVSTMPFS